jgi:HK97 family phage major capsid protein
MMQMHLHPITAGTMPASVAALLSRGRDWFCGATAEGSPEEARQKRLEEILAAAEAIMRAADAELRELTQDEQEQMTNHLAEAERIRSELDLRRSMNAWGARQGRRTTPDALPEDRRAVTLGASGRIGVRSADDLFGATLRGERAGYRGAAEFFLPIIKGHVPPRIVAAGAANEGSGTDGGFTLPGFVTAEVYDRMVSQSAFVPYARVYGVRRGQGGAVTIPARDDAEPGTEGVDGAQAQWLGESEPGERRKTKFRAVVLRLKKLAAYVAYTLELEEDSGIALDSYLTTAMGDRHAEGLDQAVVRGTGVGQPLGILNAAATITVGAEGGQTADTLTAANLLNMAARMAPQFWNGARWWVHPTCIPQLSRVAATATTDSGGAASGYGSPMRVVDFDGTTGEWRILGRPVAITDRCSTLGDRGDVIFADMAQYALAMGPQISVARSNAEGWFSAEFDLRAIMRADGQPLVEAAQTLRNSTVTASPFVTLGAR